MHKHSFCACLCKVLATEIDFLPKICVFEFVCSHSSSRNVRATVETEDKLSVTSEEHALSPTFSVTCTAAVVRKQTRIEIHQSQPTSMTFRTCDSFPKSDMKRTLTCDWCVSILVSLASRKTLKDDVKRWMSKDWRYASNTESECNTSPKLLKPSILCACLLTR